MSNYLKTKTEGVELYYQIDQAKNPKANVIINHGFAEHLERYDYVARRLVESDYNVLRYDLRGHGQTKGIKGHIHSYLDFISDADAMFELMKEKNPQLPNFMLGHSMGGLVTTLYGIKHPEKLDGQILSGAANGKLPEASTFKAKLLALASKVVPNKMMKNPVNTQICSVKEVVETYLNDPLVLKYASFNFFNEFLNVATDDVLENLTSYNLPALILHGEKDTIVPMKISENFFNSISSKDKEMIIYPDLFHEIFNEVKKNEIIDKVIIWLDEHINN